MRNLTVSVMAGALFMALMPHAEAVTLATRSECNQNGNGPVIHIDVQGPYIIQWCEEAKVNSPPYTALQNWYYALANGDVAHIMTMQYKCADAIDRNIMPPNVVNDVCF